MKPKDFKNLCILKSDLIKNALKQLDETGEKVLYVINDFDQLIGSISDGDLRKWIMEGINLDKSVENIMNKEPKFIHESDLDKGMKTKQMMLSNQIESVPIIDQDHKIARVDFWADVFKGSSKESYSKKKNKVFVMAGGEGSRLEPFTKILPKPLIPIGDQPILEKIMDKFKYYGFNEFVVSINYKAEMIQLYLSDKEIRSKYSSIEYVKEDLPLGTIGSLLLAKDQIHDTFFITNSDILTETDLNDVYNFHKENNAILTIVGCVKNSIIPYGVLNINEDGVLIQMEEKPSFKHIVNTGVYVAEPEIMDYLRLNIKKDITELIEDLKKENQKVCVYQIRDDQWFDIGQWAEYEKTRKIFERM